MNTSDRLVVALAGVYLCFAGWQLRSLRDLGSIGLDGIWPYWFATAGVACVVLAVAPHREILAVSGALAISVCAARCLAILLLITRLAGDAVPPRAPLAAATWAALAGLLAVLWLRVLRPTVGR